MGTFLQPRPSGIADRVLSVLRCLECLGHLDPETSGLVCVDCGRKYPVVNGVARFVDQQQYARSFGFQWKIYARTQLDTEECNLSEVAFRRRTGFASEDFAGKLVLDVGCGMGRFAEIATRWGANVVGVDLSLATEVAARNLHDRDATILQADVFRLPFAPESFDFIYSIGVLHHTPDCERAFKALPRLLKPAGRIAVWLYSGYNPWYRMSDLYRKITRRLPPRLLHAACYGVVPLYAIHHALKKIPAIGNQVSSGLAYALPISFHPLWEWRILDTFDWYSPWYQSKHTYEEVFRWFEECGLEQLRVLEQPLGVQGRRPAVSEVEQNREHRDPESLEVLSDRAR